MRLADLAIRREACGRGRVIDRHDTIRIKWAEVTQNIGPRRFRHANGQIVAPQIVEDRLGVLIDCILMVILRRQQCTQIMNDLNLEVEDAATRLGIRKDGNLGCRTTHA